MVGYVNGRDWKFEFWSLFLLYRKDRLWRSLELKKCPHGGGHDDKTILGLEDIKAFLSKIVIKFVII